MTNWQGETPYDGEVVAHRGHASIAGLKAYDIALALAEGYTEAMRSETVKKMYEALEDASEVLQAYGESRKSTTWRKAVQALETYEAGLVEEKGAQ